MNAGRKTALAVGLTLLPAVGLAWAFGRPAPPPPPQPIAYNHQKHVAKGLTCDNCHGLYKEHAVAGLPSEALCRECHEEQTTGTPEETRLLGYLQRGEEIPWRVVHTVPADVYFSHRRHVVLGKLECSACHGDVASRTEPFLLPASDLSMDACMACHKRSGVTNDCIACHR